jgi:hypothetical protein
MAKAAVIETRTEDFIKHFKDLKSKGLISDNKEVADLLGYSAPSAISEILGRRQNIQPEQWEKFKKKYNVNSDTSEVELLKEELKKERQARQTSEERERKALEHDKALLEDIIRTNLTMVLASLKTIGVRQEADGETILRSLERIEGTKEGELTGESDNRRAQIEKEWRGRGNVPVPGK